jgi:hypothetical protein
LLLRASLYSSVTSNTIPAAFRRRSAALGVLAFLAIAFGLFVSFRYTFAAWGRPDSDIFMTVELWRGVHQYGLRFMHSWWYTQDNWLLSLIPISSLIFELYGPRPELAVLLGWLTFVISVALTAWLAHHLAGGRCALILACVLLFGSFSAIGGAGYLAYPISHNVSMAWGLVVLLFALYGLERCNFFLCAAAALAVFIDAISDPWASAAVGVPLVIVTAALAARNRSNRLGTAAFILSLTTAIALWAARTRFFGVLGFLPKSYFEVADTQTVLVNLRWGCRAFGEMFNIVPGVSPQAPLALLLNGAALSALLGAAVVSTLAGLRTSSAGRQLISGFTLFSIFCVGFLFLLGRWEPKVFVGRFFPNLYFLGGLLVAVIAAEHWRDWRLIAKAGVAVYACLFVVAGALSAPRVWTGMAQASSLTDAADLGKFLHARGLSHGYGPYWGAYALVMDTVTQGRVTIRPVTFKGGSISRRPTETSSFWYKPTADPPGTRPFLVVKSDGEECPSAPACVGEAQRQFGLPSDKLIYRDAVVLVWQHPISPMIGK